MNEEQELVKAGLIKAALLARKIDEIIRENTNTPGEGLATLAFAFYVMAASVGITDEDKSTMLNSIKEMVDGSIAMAKQEAH